MINVNVILPSEIIVGGVIIYYKLLNYKYLRQ